MASLKVCQGYPIYLDLFFLVLSSAWACLHIYVLRVVGNL